MVAVPWFGLPGLFQDPDGALAPLIAAAAGTAASPIVTVNLWLDRQVLPDAFVGLPGRTMQWVFDTSQIRRPERLRSRWGGPGIDSGVVGERRPPVARVEPAPRPSCASPTTS